MIFMIFLNFMIEWTVMIFFHLMMGQMIMCCIEKWKLMYQLKNTSFVASVFLPRRVCFNLKMAKNFCDRERPQDWIWWILQNGLINFSISFWPAFLAILKFSCISRLDNPFKAYLCHSSFGPFWGPSCKSFEKLFHCSIYLHIFVFYDHNEPLLL